MYKWVFAWRYLHTKLIAVFGIASVMFCVAMVLVVMSVMGGFLDMVRDRSRGLHSDIVVEAATLQGFPFYDEFGAYLLDKYSNLVASTTPSIATYGIFRVPAITWTKPAHVVGRWACSRRGLLIVFLRRGMPSFVPCGPLYTRRTRRLRV